MWGVLFWRGGGGAGGGFSGGGKGDAVWAVPHVLIERQVDWWNEMQNSIVG